MRTRFKDLCIIPMGRLAFAAVAGGALVATNAFAQSAREVRGPTPYLAIENEPPPKLIVDPPLAAGLALGIAWIQYRVENVRILQVFGQAPSTYLHGSGICTYASTTCLGCGRMRVTTIPST
jgi:Family of unknown function (DUF6130)